MKLFRLLLWVVCILIVCASTAFALTITVHNEIVVSIDEDHFPDSHFRQYIIDRIDTNTDGFLSEYEIGNVKQIYVSNYNISTLKGIEYFTSLLGLSCGYNQLQAIDISNNLALEYLSCDNNQLQQIDLSHNLELRDLVCDSNLLASLDISNNRALEYLSCENNQLQEIDVSHNLQLSDLNCDSNLLVSLNVTNNPELVSLRCRNNRIKGLELNHRFLTFLDCRDNALTSLNIRNCPALLPQYTLDNYEEDCESDNYIICGELQCDSGVKINGGEQPYASTLELEGIKEIGEGAFEGTAANIVYINSECNSIGSKAFANCPNLHVVYFWDCASPEIADDAFEGCKDFCISGNYDEIIQHWADEHGILWGKPKWGE